MLTFCLFYLIYFIYFTLFYLFILFIVFTNSYLHLEIVNVLHIIIYYLSFIIINIINHKLIIKLQLLMDMKHHMININ